MAHQVNHKHLLLSLLFIFSTSSAIAQTNYWDGSHGFDWEQPLNWSLNVVPTAAHDVIVPGGLGYFDIPFIYEEDSVVCKTLTTYSGMRMAGVLEVFGDYYISTGPLNISKNSKLIVHDDIEWAVGSAAIYVSSGGPGYAEIYVYDNWTFGSLSAVDLEDIRVYMVSSNPCVMISRSTGSQFDRLYLQKDNASVQFSSSSSQDLVANYIYNGDVAHPLNTFISNSAQNIVINISMENESQMQFNSGSIVFNRSSTVEFNSGDYFNNVDFYVPTSYGVWLNGDVWVRGDLVTHNAGGSVYLNDTLRLEGDFDNRESINIDIADVIIQGNAFQNVYGLHCETLELNKSGGELRFPEMSSSCDDYDWTSGLMRVNGGNFNAYDLVDPGIFGTISVTSGQLFFTQDPAQFIDLRAYLFITGGSFFVHGGNGSSYWPWQDNATLIMNGGDLYFKNGIRLNNNANLITNITGGTIHTEGEFIVDRTDFDPTGGTIRMHNHDGNTTVNLKCAAGSNLFNLTVAKHSTDTVNTTSDIEIDGDVHLQAGKLKSDDIIRVAGDWTSVVKLVEAGGTVIFDGDSDQTFTGLEYFDGLTLDNGPHELLMTPLSAIHVESYNWESGTLHQDDANVTFEDLFDFSLYGNYILENGSRLIARQDSLHSADLNANLSILSNSQMYLQGGDGVSHWANFQPVSIEMDGGYFSLWPNGIVIDTFHNFTENITGGEITCWGDFVSWSPDFTPTGGQVTLKGEDNADVRMKNGSHFYDLELFKVDDSETLIGTATAQTDLIIQNDFEIQRGHFQSMDMEVGGDWTNMEGPQAFDEGIYAVTFFGPSSSVINGSEIFYDLIIDKTSPIFQYVFIGQGDSLTVLNDCEIDDGRIRFYDSTYLEIRGDAQIASGSGVNADGVDPVKIVLGGDWINHATSGGFLAGTSTFKLDGYQNQAITQDYRSGSIYNFVIENHDYEVDLTHPMKVEKDLTIIKGDVFAPDSIWVGGNWSNFGGTSSFVEGTGIVLFDGPGPTDIITNEDFYDLRIEKTYTGFDGVEVNADKTINIQGDLNIYTGTVELNDNSTLDVDGDLTITANAGLNAQGDTGLEIFVGGDWTDFNSAWSNKIGFSPGTSTVTFDGPLSQAVNCNATDADFYRFVIDKPSDVLTEDFVYFLTNMKILNDVVVYDGRWYDLPTGGYTHQFYNSLVVYPGGKWYGGNSTIVFKRDGDQKWNASPSFHDCTFHNVTIDKPSGQLLLIEDVQSISGGFLSVQNGTLNLNGNDFYVGGDAEVLLNGNLVNKNGGTLIIGSHP